MAEIPRISIIIPVYNKCAQLPGTLESVLKVADAEIIPVDDASTDSCASILKEYAERYEHVKPVYRSENGGLSSARNTGLKAATGDYVLFWDADDILNSDTINHLLKLADDNDSDVARGVLARRKSSGGERWLSIRSQKLRFHQHNTDFSKSPVLLNDFSSCSYIIRRVFLVDNDITFADGLYMQDVLFSVQLYLRAKRICITPMIIGDYIQDTDSWSNVRSQARFDSMERLFDLLESEMDHSAVTDDLRAEINAAFINTSVNTFLQWKSEAGDIDDLIRIRALLERCGDDVLLRYAVGAGSIGALYPVRAALTGNYDLIIRFQKDASPPRISEIRELFPTLGPLQEAYGALGHIENARMKGEFETGKRGIVNSRQSNWTMQRIARGVRRRIKRFV